MVASGSIDLARLITHRFPIDRGEDAYKLISGDATEPYLGIVLQYDAEKELSSEIKLKSTRANTSNAVRIGMIGAGSYARKFLLPNFKSNGVEFCTIASASGFSARDIGGQYGFASCVSDADQVIADAAANLIVIATRHDTHAALARKALEHNKHVFVEKPLAMNDAELDAVITAAANSTGRLMVGYNRRFSPAAKHARDFFGDRQSPLSIVFRVNAGRIPRDSWIQDPVQGGGRIVGEVCHFIDLMHFLTGSVTTRVYAESVTSCNHKVIAEDSAIITLRFADGSNGTIAYLAEGDKTLAKERIEIFGEGKSFVIDDFRRTYAYKNNRETTKKSIGQDKGQAEEVRKLFSMIVGGGESPIALDDLRATTRATFRVLDALRTGQSHEV